MGIDKIPDPLNITNGKCHDDYSAGKRDRGKETPSPRGGGSPGRRGAKPRLHWMVWTLVENFPALLVLYMIM